MLLSNALLNLVGLATPLLVGVVTLPSIVHGLGPDRFGILSLGLVVLGYFAVFDLGLGRATTRFMAERARADTDTEIAATVWTAAAMQTMVGALGGLLLAASVGLLVERVFTVPQALHAEASRAFRLLALAVPITAAATSFRGVLEGHQHFRVLNAIDAPVAAAGFLVMLGGLGLGFGLGGIVILLVALRLVGSLALMAAATRICPALRKVVVRPEFAADLLRFGGWVTLSALVGPILVYVDRFFLGMLWSVSLVGYYAAPYDVVTRLAIVPLSVATVLFPAASALDPRRDGDGLRRLATRSLAYVGLMLAPVVVGLVVAARTILTVWLGREFASHATRALQLLAPGVFVNALALVPYSLLHAAGRPDIPAKLHLLELPVHTLVAWWLVSRGAVTGAAAAWTLRVCIDALLLFAAASRLALGAAPAGSWKTSGDSR